MHVQSAIMADLVWALSVLVCLHMHEEIPCSPSEGETAEGLGIHWDCWVASVLQDT